MKKSSKTLRKNNNILGDIAKIFPLIVIISIVPLIVFLKVVPVNSSTALFTNGSDNLDFFSYYKMTWLLVFATLGMILYLFKFIISRKSPVIHTLIYYPMVAFIILAAASTIFSKYKNVALFGFVDRYEGMLVLIAYMCLIFLGLNLLQNENQLKYLFYSLGLSAIVMIVLGFTQFIGNDFLMTDIGKRLILPARYQQISSELSSIFSQSNSIYATLYNINYVGVYMSMIFALTTTMFITLDDKKTRIFFAALSLMSLFTIIGSRSRAAMFGVIFYIVLIVLMFRLQLLRRWKPISIIILLVFVVLLGINTFRDGLVTKRFTSGVKSLTEINMVDFKDLLLYENKAMIIFDDYSMTIESLNDGLVFRDTFGYPLEMTNNGSILRANIEPYNKHSFEMQIHKNNPVLKANIRTNRGTATFRIVSDHGDMKVMYYDSTYFTNVKAPYIGFEGREQIASNRGYIWSRTLPLISNSLFLGYGPDTFALHFPQNDYVGKIIGFGDTNIVVDKPHNMYLQTAVNTGVLSLLALIAMWVQYILKSTKLYYRKVGYDSFVESAGISIFLAISVYLFTGFTNDSIVSVSPVFWTLFGMGLWVNYQLEHNLKSITNSK